MKTRNRPLASFALAIASLGFAATTASAVDVSVTASPPGPIDIGDEVTIRLAVNSWDPGDSQVDAIAFNVDFDTAVFEFVPGSGKTLANGTEFLALPSQGAGYNLGDDSSEALVGFGRYIFGASDTTEGTSGSLGPDALVGEFTLRAIAAGTGCVEATSNNPKLVFSDPEYFGIDPTGGVNLNTVKIDVRPAPGVTYPTWAATIPFANQDDSKPDADPDCDGRVNAIEYFLDADPLGSDPGRDPQPGTTPIGNRNYQTLTYERAGGARVRLDAKDHGERSTDLKSWSRNNMVVESVGAVDPNTGRETVVLRSTIAFGVIDREYLRLVIELDRGPVIGAP